MNFLQFILTCTIFFIHHENDENIFKTTKLVIKYEKLWRRRTRKGFSLSFFIFSCEFDVKCIQSTWERMKNVERKEDEKNENLKPFWIHFATAWNLHASLFYHSYWFFIIFLLVLHSFSPSSITHRQRRESSLGDCWDCDVCLRS